MLETCNRAADDTSKPVDRIESCILFIKNVALVGSSEQVSILRLSKENLPRSAGNNYSLISRRLIKPQENGKNTLKILLLTKRTLKRRSATLMVLTKE